MGIAYNPKIVTNGLVFAYDMYNPQKSWKGAPTTNVINTNLSDYAKDSGCTVELQPTTFDGNPIYRVTFPSGTLPRIRTNFTYTASQQFTGSIFYRVVIQGSHNPQLIFREAGFGTTYATSTLTSQEWTKATITHTFSNSGTSMFLLYQSSSSSTSPTVIDFSMPQSELSSFATPFVDGTRSNTQAILDLTNNNTITASSLTYASDNTFSFNRTNNNTLLTSLSITSTPALSNFTYEVFLNITSLPPASNNGVILGATYYSGAAIYWRTNGSNFNIKGFIRGNDAYRATAEYTLALNTVYHIVLTNNYSSGTLNLYINGVLFSSVATATQEYNTTNIASAGNIGINKPQVDGGGSETYSYFTGRVDTAKIYNRALSAQEVQQNFEAFRGRFGI